MLNEILCRPKIFHVASNFHKNFTYYLHCKKTVFIRSFDRGILRFVAVKFFSVTMITNVGLHRSFGRLNIQYGP